jgi:sulfate adenylyltransferase
LTPAYLVVQSSGSAIDEKTPNNRSRELSEPYYDVIRPHGGTLVDRVLRGEMREAVKERAAQMVKVPLGPMGLSDLELISNGALSPLTGFMLKADYDRCVEEMRLTNGLIWSVPVTLAVEDDLAGQIDEGQEIALCEGDQILAVMEVAEKHPYDRAVKEREASQVYKTTEDAHPGVARLYRQGNVFLGGDVWLVDWPSAVGTEFPELRHTPAQTRRMFARRGWRSVVGFQTRNPIHRAHEYIQKTALEIVDGLLLHPLVGETKKDDIPADVRIASYQTILRDYYPADRVVLGVFPAAMRYAGPREAIFHAIARKNYGCTHFIVGRDHAGVGKYYGTYDAQNIFDELSQDEIDITPLRFEHAFFCNKCGMVVSAKTCPHGKDDWVFLSGTQVREMLERGEMLPEEFTRPEVAKVLLEGIRQQQKDNS